MHLSVVPLAAIFRLNTQLWLNCLAGLSDAQANDRHLGRVNTIAFLAAHLTETRHYLATLVGSPRPSPFSPAFAKARSLDEAGPLPPLDELTAYWEAISAHIAVAIERLDTAALSRAAAALPGSDGTVLGDLAFLAQHESYHVGQMGLLRRALGLPGMRYDLPPREPGRLGA